MTPQHPFEGKATRGEPGPFPFALVELSDRCMGNIAIAVLVLEKFELQAQRDVQEIEKLLAVGNAGKVAGTAHALKGAAGAVAAHALHDLAARIETLARQDRLDSVNQELAGERGQQASVEVQLAPEWKIGSSTSTTGASGVELIWHKRY